MSRRAVWALGLAVLLLSAALLTAEERVQTGQARLSKADLEKVADYFLNQILGQDSGKNEIRFDPVAVETATGIRMTEADANRILPLLMAKLQATSEGKALLAASSCTTESSCAAPGASTASAGASCAAQGKSCSANCGASVSRCAEYGACSVYSDLSGATGEALEMYAREKATDGEKYSGRAIPAFEAKSLSADAVRSKDLVGKPTVLVTLAVHCSHSHETLPILNELEKKYGPKGLEVVGVFVNSGTVEDMNTWIGYYEPNYDVWVSPTDALGDVIDSHLVPTYLLVDARGNVKEKLVGFKTQQEVEERLAEHFVLSEVANESRAGEE